MKNRIIFGDLVIDNVYFLASFFFMVQSLISMMFLHCFQSIKKQLILVIMTPIIITIGAGIML